MSTEPSVDQELLDQTKQQIRGLVAEIAQLSKADVSPLEFYAEFLTRLVQALAAPGGAVWIRGESGGLELGYQINLQQTKLADNEADQVRHGRILQSVVERGEGMLVPPRSGAGDDEEAANPTEFLLVLGPLKSDQTVEGVVEVFQRASTTPSAQRGYLRFVMQMCELAGEFLKTRQLRHFTDRQALWTRLEDFTRMAHMSLDPQRTAYTIANEGRRLIECDRVSIAIRKGRKCHIEAISGQDTFDRRSNTVVLLAELATAATAAGEAIWYTGDTTDMAPQVEEAVQAYVDDSHSKTVAVLPLKKPSDDPDEEQRSRDVIGALIVEQIEDSRLREGFTTRVEVVAEHSELALANAIAHHSLFLLPLWRLLGKARLVVQARTLPKTAAVVICLALLVAWLVAWPGDFKLEATGRLVPIVQSDVFAPMDGDVEEVLVRHGQAVREHDVLLRMNNPQLDISRNEVIGRINSINGRLGSLLRLYRISDRPSQEKEQYQAEELEEREHLKSAKKQLRLYDLEQEKLDVKSPLSGQIITSWDELKNLRKRPVQRGQRLTQVFDPSQGYAVELHMPDHRVAHITAAQKEFGDDLVVQYVLATEPGDEHTGKIEEIHLAAEVHDQEEGNTVLIRVGIEQSDLPEYVRPGATVTAKVYCGKKPMGYVLFHDLIAWVQRTWFRFF